MPKFVIPEKHMTFSYRNLRNACIGTLVILLFAPVTALAGVPSGTVQTWDEAADRWNLELTTTDQLLLCVNFANTAGPIAYGIGDKKGGARFADIANRFIAELRLVHDDETADLLLRATFVVMINTIEIAGTDGEYDAWVDANLYRCKDLAERLK